MIDRELEVVRGAIHQLVHRALALDGTCTGEPGVGLGKKDYLYEELGVGTVDLMHRIKNTIDPMNLFNPGKVHIGKVSSSPLLNDLSALSGPEAEKTLIFFNDAMPGLMGHLTCESLILCHGEVPKFVALLCWFNVTLKPRSHTSRSLTDRAVELDCLDVA